MGMQQDCCYVHSTPLQLPEGPALPPRISTRFREHSLSPQPPENPLSPPLSTGSETPPPKPPRRVIGDSDNPEQPSRESSQEHSDHTHPPHPPIEPYSVTTITPMDSNQSAPSKPSNGILRRSESPRPPVNVPIPPPAIVRQAGHSSSNLSASIYYSIPVEEGGRSLLPDGRFGRPGSVHGSESSHEGDVEGGGERGRLEEGRPEEVGEEAVGDVLKKVTEVVKAVMELSNKVSLSPPDEYVELVKVSHSSSWPCRLPLGDSVLCSAARGAGHERAAPLGGHHQTAAAAAGPLRGGVWGGRLGQAHSEVGCGEGG